VLYGLGPLSVSVVMVSYFNSHQLRFYSNRIRLIRGSAIPIMLRMLVTVNVLATQGSSVKTTVSWLYYFIGTIEPHYHSTQFPGLFIIFQEQISWFFSLG